MLFIFLLLFINTSFAEINLNQDFYKHFTGKINKKYEITVNMLKVKDRIVISYYYNKYGKLLYLNGSIQPNGQINFSNENESFSGVLYDNYIIGKWQSNNKSYPFELVENYAKGSVAFTPMQWQEETENADFKALYLHPSQYENTHILHKLQHSIKQEYIMLEQSILNYYLKNKINLKDNMQNIQKALITDFFTQFQKEITTLSEEEKEYAYHNSKEFISEIVYNSNYILSISYGFYTYDGGAHGNYGEGFTIYDLTTGNTLTKEDIFKQNSYQAIEKLLLQQFKEDRNLQPEESVQGWLFEEHIPVNDNIYLTHGGVGFHYVPYEISPYAVGSIDIFLPIHKIKPYLNAKILSLLY